MTEMQITEPTVTQVLDPARALGAVLNGGGLLCRGDGR